MREIVLSAAESDANSLVFTLTGDSDGDQPEPEQLFCVVTDQLRELIAGSRQADTPPAAKATGETSSPDLAAPAALPAPAASEKTPQAGDAPAAERGGSSTMKDRPRLKMRPRDIQQRIRGGATVQEIAAEAGVSEERIEAFAHPVLAERARMAEVARSSHPARTDGPAPLTLFEVLATAFAARGLSVADTTWDAFKDPAGQWIIRISWEENAHRQDAEFTYQAQGMSQATTVARNAAATELIDPEAEPPARSQPAGGPAARHLVSIASQPGAVDDAADGPAEGDGELSGPAAAAPSATAEPDPGEGADEGFLQNPQSGEDSPAAGRKRRAVTPHWEDVLLGVRTNTKRPRS